jgi:GGDEF domain-containing protein
VSEAGGTDAFVGHVGGDDFIVVCEPNRAISIADAIVAAFDEQVGLLYDPADQEQGYIEVTDRAGEVHRHPFLAISVGIATTLQRPFGSAVEAAAVAAEMKQVAKQQPGSAWRLDRRRA